MVEKCERSQLPSRHWRLKKDEFAIRDNSLRSFFVERAFFKFSKVRNKTSLLSECIVFSLKSIICETKNRIFTTLGHVNDSSLRLNSRLVFSNRKKTIDWMTAFYVTCPNLPPTLAPRLTNNKKGRAGLMALFVDFTYLLYGQQFCIFTSTTDNFLKSSVSCSRSLTDILLFIICIDICMFHRHYF